MPGLAGLSCKIERGRLDGLLLVAGQAGEAVGECVGDAEFHGGHTVYVSARRLTIYVPESVSTLVGRSFVTPPDQ